MPTVIHTSARRHPAFTAHYIALLFLSLHWAGVLYINSSFIGQFVSEKTISILYVVGSLVTVVAFLYASHALTKIGNVRLTASATIIEAVTLIGMAFAPSATMAISLFIIHQAIVPIILFGLDIFIETETGSNEDSTGQQRGVILTVIGITYAIAPFVAGYLLGSGTPDFTTAYLLSALLLIPFLYVVFRHLRKFNDPVYAHLNIRDGLSQFWKHIDVRNVFFAHFTLQIFFAWMVIYTPLYLKEVIGLNWEEIGAILAVGLTAYVFLEYAVGYIADNHLGEKEMMAFGFAVTAVATSWFIFLDDASVTLWMVAMFMTRVGASFIESTTESYFFKHTQGKDANVIGMFRMTKPLSNVVGAGLGGIVLHFLTFDALFLILGLLMVPGMFFAMALNDTR